MKLQTKDLKSYKKETPAQVFFCVVYEIFNNDFFTEHPQGTASALLRIFRTFDYLILSA